MTLPAETEASFFNVFLAIAKAAWAASADIIICGRKYSLDANLSPTRFKASSTLSFTVLNGCAQEVII